MTTPWRKFWSLVSATALLCLWGAGALPAAEEPPVKPPSHTIVGVSTMNPHLHVSLHALQPGGDARHVAGISHVEHMPQTGVVVIRVVHETWAPRWDAHAFIVLHRGLATIEGFVRDAAGKPISNVRVGLQRPGGHPLAHTILKHITHTSADGRFIMTDVRPRSYRIIAVISVKNKAVHSHVQRLIHPNETANVTLQF